MTARTLPTIVAPITIALAVVLLGGDQTASAAGLINGGFEQPGVPGIHYLAPGSHFIPGWTTVDTTPGGDFDVAIQDSAAFGFAGVVASEGDYFVELTGDVGRGKGVRSDAISLTSGDVYQVAFDVGAFYVAGFGSFGDVTIDLLVNGVFAQSFTNILSRTTPGTEWDRFTYDFTATGPSADFTFIASTLVSSSALGAGLDNVSVSNLTAAAVPEPATWALTILGLASVGASLRRKRVRGGVVALTH